MTNDLPTKLAQLLQAIFDQQARETMSKVRLSGGAPDLSSWVKATAEVVQPLMVDLWQRGMIQAAARVGAKVVQADDVAMPRVPYPSELPTSEMFTTQDILTDLRRLAPGNDAIFGSPAKSWQETIRPHLIRPSVTLTLKNNRSKLVLKATRKGKQPDLNLSFDLFNPKVIDAVNRATMEFCRETMETATSELTVALDELRRKMREGLAAGDAVSALAIKVRTIFADPARAFRIAATEGSRAVHGGQMMLAHEAGVTKHSWLASSDCCPDCAKLNGKTVDIGKPFIVLPKGGTYATVLHPPLHPYCFLYDDRRNLIDRFVGKYTVETVRSKRFEHKVIESKDPPSTLDKVSCLSLILSGDLWHRMPISSIAKDYEVPSLDDEVHDPFSVHRDLLFEFYADLDEDVVHYDFNVSSLITGR